VSERYDWYELGRCMCLEWWYCSLMVH